MVLFDRNNITPLSGAVIALVGVGLFGVAGVHVLVEHRDPIAVLLGGVVPMVIAASVVAGGIHLARSGLPPRSAARIAGWWLLGVAVTATMGLAVLVYAWSHGVVLADGPFVVTNNVTAGSAGGLAVGFYESRSRRQTRALATEREKLALLNRVLGHDVRNDLNVVLLSAQLIAERVDDGTLEYVRKVERAATEAVELTETTATFLETLDRDCGRDLHPVDLGEVVVEQIERARETYPNATIRWRGVAPVAVRTDELFPAVVWNLLTNAIHHNDSDGATVDVEAEVDRGSVTLRVADDGPGVPDDRKEEVFGRGERGLESEGSGIGLYLVDALVDDYGGDVWIEDRESGGAVFVVQLRLAGRELPGPRRVGERSVTKEERPAP